MTDRELLKRLERCFDQDELQTFIAWDPGPGVTVGAGSAAVKVFHVPSGLEATCDQSRSQVRNKAAAILQLLQLLHTSSG